MKILVFGWYGHGNLGDEAFKKCISQMWPHVDFVFSDYIPSDVNLTYDALWLGGGSFLDQPVKDIETVIIPIYLIGVGIPSQMPPVNRRALEKAKFIVCRDSQSYSNSPNRANTFLATDLVFTRKDIIPLREEKTNQITVILNDFLTPVGNVPDWKSLSYYWFLQEFAKILDRFLSQDYTVKLIPMCVNPRIDDRRIAAAVQGRSMFPELYDWQLSPITELDLRTEISKSAFVVTQRFHGLVYSILERTPCLTLCAHSKFNNLVSDLKLPSVDYYGLTDVKFRESLSQLMSMPFEFTGYIESASLAWDRAKEYMM